MFIIQDAQLSHNLTLLSVVSFHHVTAHGDLLQGFWHHTYKEWHHSADLFSSTFLCVDVAKHYSPCSVCVVVVLWLLCMHERVWIVESVVQHYHEPQMCGTRC